MNLLTFRMFLEIARPSLIAILGALDPESPEGKLAAFLLTVLQAPQPAAFAAHMAADPAPHVLAAPLTDHPLPSGDVTPEAMLAYAEKLQATDLDEDSF